jgi:cell wall-associated NlpC family hydrolase
MIYRDLIGIPFKSGGDDTSGINCYNLMRKIYALHGYKLPETNLTASACAAVFNEEVEAQIKTLWQRINEPEKLCCILMTGRDCSFTDHVATYIGSGKIFHIRKETNSIIERLHPYRHQIKGIYKFKGIKQCQ